MFANPKRKRPGLRALATVLCLVCASGATIARADPADFYKSNPIRMIVGFGPGGGVDLYSRLLARFFGANIPGNPGFIVENMPGAGSMKALQALKTGAKDGSLIAAFNPGNILVSVLDPGSINFRFNELAYLGSISEESQVCYTWHTKNIKTFDEFLRQDKINVGVTSSTDSEYMVGALLRELFGAKIHHVAGYRSKPEINLALQRGELDGSCGSFDGVPKDWLEANKLDMIVRLSNTSPPGVAEIPYIGKWANDRQMRIIHAALAINEIFRPYAVARETPAERLAALRKGFFATVTSASFLEAAQNIGRTVQNPRGSDDVTRIVDEILKLPPEMVEDVRAAVH